MHKFFNKSMVLAMGLALCACDADPEDIQDESIVDIDERAQGVGTIRFNTDKIGDKAFAALHGQYKEYNKNQLLSVTLFIKNETEVKCKEVWAEKGELHCRDTEGFTWDNWTFEGSIWKLDLNGEDESLIVGDMAHQGDTWLYRFNDLASGPDKVPTCDEDLDNPGTFWSVVLNDVDVTEDGKVFDEAGLVYLACTSGSLGKTVEQMGINPWEQGNAQYNAGVYMTMLAPCGDRNSLTSPGTPLRVWDKFGINNFGVGAPHESEGVWGPEGMVCSGKKLRTGWLSEEIKCGNVTIPVCEEAELKDIVLTDPEINIWSKPKA